MARTSFTVQVAPGAYVAPTTLAWTAFTGATATGGNQFVLTGAEIILLRNWSTTTASVLLQSVSDPQGRTGNYNAGLSTGQVKMFGPINTVGWIQTDGKFYLETTSTDIYAAVVKVPGL